MSVRRKGPKDPKTGKNTGPYFIDIDTRKLFNVSDRLKPRVRRNSIVQTRRGAEQYERQVRQQLLDGTFEQKRKEIPTFEKWFEGRFWREWVIAQMNKPSEQENKKCIFRCHLKERFGHLRLDEIVYGNHIPDYRASLVERVQDEEFGLKRVNNILAVLSKALHYAEDQRLIDRAPKVGLFKIERPEIVWWELEQYSRILAAAKAEDPMWYAAVCLAGEAGLRIGEVRALKWERDIDLIAGTVTVNEQTRKGITGTPKGRTRRTIPMTATLMEAIKGLSVVRRGYVVRNDDGTPTRDGQDTHAILRICRKAGLPERAWHCLRHTFGTHSALFGVNPWRLQAWMGHKNIEETMRYVHVSEGHMRPIPAEVLAAGQSEPDFDRRIMKMLGARIKVKMGAGNREEKSGSDQVTAL
jgi:integrase